MPHEADHLQGSEKLPRGSKHPIFKASGPKVPFRVWFLEPESLNIGYLDPLGYTSPAKDGSLRGTPKVHGART